MLLLFPHCSGEISLYRQFKWVDLWKIGSWKPELPIHSVGRNVFVSCSFRKTKQLCIWPICHRFSFYFKSTLLSCCFLSRASLKTLNFLLGIFSSYSASVYYSKRSQIKTGQSQIERKLNAKYHNFPLYDPHRFWWFQPTRQDNRLKVEKPKCQCVVWSKAAREKLQSSDKLIPCRRKTRAEEFTESCWKSLESAESFSKGLLRLRVRASMQQLRLVQAVRPGCWELQSAPTSSREGGGRRNICEMWVTGCSMQDDISRAASSLICYTLTASRRLFAQLSVWNNKVDTNAQLWAHRARNHPPLTSFNLVQQLGAHTLTGGNVSVLQRLTSHRLDGKVWRLSPEASGAASTRFPDLGASFQAGCRLPLRAWKTHQLLSSLWAPSILSPPQCRLCPPASNVRRHGSVSCFKV